MGEMADMLIDQAIEGLWDDEWYEPAPRKVLVCNQCHKKNLQWRRVKGHWVMFEPNAKRLHTCEKYTAPIEVLKELALQVGKVHRQNILDNLYNHMMKSGGFKKIVNIVNNDQLLDLFIRVNREHGVIPDCIGMAWPSDYSKQLAQIRTELLRRMK